MPELPEVEILARHLRPKLLGHTIRSARLLRPKIARPLSPASWQAALRGACFTGLERRGKFLVFTLCRDRPAPTLRLVGHLGMTGRMYFQPPAAPLPRHTTAVLELDGAVLVFEDPRGFGRLTLAESPWADLGPEPLSNAFTAARLAAGLRRSKQAVKIKLLDQSLVAGLGNIYASEALFLAGISPQKPACGVSREEAARLRRAIRKVLAEAIRLGSTVPLNFSGHGQKDGFFYYGRADGPSSGYAERLQVYGREGQPCYRCRQPIRRIRQAGRSTYYCPGCQT